MSGLDKLDRHRPRRSGTRSREAEQLIADPPFEVSEQDLAEGYDYLAGSIRSSLQMAFDYDLEHPVLINPTHQYARQGLDNPDAVYFNAFLAPEGSYLDHRHARHHRRPVLPGAWTGRTRPRARRARSRRSTTASSTSPPTAASSGASARSSGLQKGSTLIVREVYDDWNAEQRGTIRIQRLDTAGRPRGPLTQERVAKRYGVAAKMLVGRIKTWFAFPEWFTYKEPVNTLTEPR